jgi:hypothetical protein
MSDVEDTFKMMNTSNFEEPSKTFVKHDSEKLRPSLFPINAYEDILKVIEYGARKYEKDNWRECEDLTRYIDACERHIIEYKKGNKIDSGESRLKHLAHAATNLIFILELDK